MVEEKLSSVFMFYLPHGLVLKCIKFVLNIKKMVYTLIKKKHHIKKMSTKPTPPHYIFNVAVFV